MQLIKLTIIIIVVEFKLMESGNLMYYDLDNQKMLQFDRKSPFRNELLNNKKLVNFLQKLRRKRNNLNELDGLDSSFSGQTVLNDNARQTFSENDRIKKMEKNRKMNSNLFQNEIRKCSHHRKKKMKSNQQKRTIKFSQNVELPEQLDGIFRPSNYEELKQSYYNGFNNNLVDDDQQKFIADDEEILDRKKKDIFEQHQPQTMCIFQGQLANPQFNEELSSNNICTNNNNNNNTKQFGTQMVYNPLKPSLILDSVAPNSIKHIDRNIVEEVIQVDIPVQSQFANCVTITSTPNKTTECTFRTVAVTKIP